MLTWKESGKKMLSSWAEVHLSNLSQESKILMTQVPVIPELAMGGVSSDYLHNSSPAPQQKYSNTFSCITNQVSACDIDNT